MKAIADRLCQDEGWRRGSLRTIVAMGHGRPIADRMIYDGLTMATMVAFRRNLVGAIVDRNSRDALAIVLAID